MIKHILMKKRSAICRRVNNKSSTPKNYKSVCKLTVVIRLISGLMQRLLQ